MTLELVLRFRFLHPFYSNHGTLPPELLLQRVDDVYPLVCWAHCVWAHELWQQQVLLGLQTAVAVLLTLGIQTRLMSIVSWYLYLSLTLRNTWMNYILDRYFHYLLFLAMFLPLDANYCIITKNRTTTTQPITTNRNSNSTVTTTSSTTPSWYLSPATMAFKLLVVWIYVDAGYGKYQDQGWSFHADPLPALDTYARHTLPAQYLYALLGPAGLQWLTPTVVYVELLAAPVALLGLYFWGRTGRATAVVLV